jgi:hypothetical protein
VLLAVETPSQKVNSLNLLRKSARWVSAIRRRDDSPNLIISEREALVMRQDVEARIAREEGRLILTDYPYYPNSRPIEGTPSGQRLVTRFEAEASSYTATLNGVAKHIDSLLRIPREQGASDSPFWENSWFPPLDGATLYGLIAEHRPRRYIEVGSGISTRFVRQAIRDHGLQTRIISIDPHPRIEINALCDEVIRYPMEDVPRDFWEGIGPDDLLFVDNSHRSFPGSDVTVFFTEVLPTLRPGTVWGLHDIFLPQDYPEEWRDRFYNEQYLLLMYLLGGANNDEIILPVAWVALQPKLHGILTPLWSCEGLFRGLRTAGGSFWMRCGG